MSICRGRPPISPPIAATRASNCPTALDYAQLPGLSNEAKQKLQAVRPRTIGQAGRIDGMTPAALTLLVAHLKRKGRGRAQIGEPRRLAPAHVRHAMQDADVTVEPVAAPPDLAADRARALALTPVSRETLERLDRFVELLLSWQRTDPI